MKKNLCKYSFFLVVTLFSVLLGVSCTTAKVEQNAPLVADTTEKVHKEYELTVLHTNDHHGTVVSKDGKAGLAERATYVKGIRNSYDHVLVLDAGDLNTGSALSNMFNAEPDIKAYNMIGYDALVLGNHEFDGSLEKLKQQMKLAKHPWIAANIVDSTGNPFVKPYIIKDFDGLKVGILGLTTVRTTVVASPDKSLQFLDEIETARKYVNILRNDEKVDLLILLGHIGSVEEAENQNTSLNIAASVAGIDLIIDGHSHSKFEEPLVINNTPIVSANEWGKFMGEGHFKIIDGKVDSFDWKPVEITTEAFPPDEEVLAMLDPYIEKANKSLKEVVMNTTSEFPFGDRLTRYQETAIGNLVCDATIYYVNKTGVSVDFAIQNGGGMRTAIPKGDVTKEDILTVLPFDNTLYVISLTGNEVLELFDFIASIPQGAGAFAQVSDGVQYTITYADGVGSISNLTIHGEPVNPDKTYKIITNDYLAKGGDGYTVFTKSKDSFNTSMSLSNAVIDYAQSLGSPISPKTSKRITIVGGISQ